MEYPYLFHRNDMYVPALLFPQCTGSQPMNKNEARGVCFIKTYTSRCSIGHCFLRSRIYQSEYYTHVSVKP